MARAAFYLTERLGPKQSLTPEGFLLCEEVPVARAGMMLYGPEETPIKAGPDGFVKIHRESDDIHDKRTISSATGKSVTYDHPDDDVTPDTWLSETVGIMMNVRPGTAAQDDLLFADLLITVPRAIEAVQSGKRREVSLGYEADYEETGKGVGRQTNIVINHVALVENGRCGPRCAIGDQKTVPTNREEAKMTVKKRSSFADYLMRAFKAKDAEEVEKLAEEANDEGLGEGINPESNEVHVHLNGEGGSGRSSFTDDDIQEHIDRNEAEHQEMFSRIEELEKLVSDLAGGNTEDKRGKDDVDPELQEQMLDEVPEEMREEAAKAKDSAFLADSFQDTVALAEILVPGIKIPTFDAAATPAHSFKKLCKFRRNALDKAYANSETKNYIDDLLGGKALDTSRMTCDAVRTLFRGAAAMRRSANNTRTRSTGDHAAIHQDSAKKPMTLAELNRLNAERYK